MTWLFSIHLAVTWMLVGLIWVVQILVYPQFRRVAPAEFRDYHFAHCFRIGLIVGPLLFVEAATAAWLLYAGRQSLPFIISTVLIPLIWLTTAVFQAPVHTRLGRGFDAPLIHRLILTSRTWRQVTDPRTTLERERLYYGAKLQRLDAESLRDAMLAVTGKLHPQTGGEPVSVARDLTTGRIVLGREVINPGNGMIDKIETAGENVFRRSLYIESRRSRPLTVLDTFDLPLMNPNCTVRTVTTVAPQSLLLMNDAFSIEQAQALAERLQREAPEHDLSRIHRAWALLYGKVPQPLDIARSLVFLHDQRRDLEQQGREAGQAATEALAAWCQVMLGTNQFLYLE